MVIGIKDTNVGTLKQPFYRTVINKRTTFPNSVPFLVSFIGFVNSPFMKLFFFSFAIHLKLLAVF